MRYRFIISLILVIITSISMVTCNFSHSEDEIEKYKTEIINTEKEFASKLQKDGWTAAFYAFADSDAVINHGKKLIIGKEDIKRYYLNRKNDRDILLWSPDFIDVSKSGDLGYTYGKYTYVGKDSLGNAFEDSGYFHTVWKRQSDGSWKYVWD